MSFQSPMDLNRRHSPCQDTHHDGSSSRRQSRSPCHCVVRSCWSVHQQNTYLISVTLPRFEYVAVVSDKWWYVCRYTRFFFCTQQLNERLVIKATWEPQQMSMKSLYFTNKKIGKVWDRCKMLLHICIYIYICIYTYIYIYIRIYCTYIVYIIYT